MTTVEILNSSQSNEWFTPTVYLDAVRAVLGQIDLDPASCVAANERVQAGTFYTEADDGLSRPWFGRVFLNPPYGRVRGNQSSAGAWVCKLVGEYRAGRVTEAVVLVNAQMSDGWLRPLQPYPMAFSVRRIRFDAPHGQGQSPTHGNLFAYLGPHIGHFLAAFVESGLCWMPNAPDCRGRAANVMHRTELRPLPAIEDSSGEPL